MRRSLATGLPKSGFFYRPPRRGKVVVPRFDKRSSFPKPGSRSAAIVDDLKEGVLANVRIAEKHKCTSANVSLVHRRAVERGVLPAREGEWVIAFGVGYTHLLHEIAMEATARGTDAKQLVRTIIITVAQKNLFDRILGQLR